MGCNQELHIIQLGCNEECRAGGHVKEVGKMSKSSEERVFRRAKELGPHPVGNPESFKDFKQKNGMIRFVFLNNKNKHYTQCL